MADFKAVLELEHPIYAAQKATWERNERRMEGGDDVLVDLRRFDWETEEGDEFRARKESASYINFGQMYADLITGHLMRHKPDVDSALSFGSLGAVIRPQGSSTPSRAELAYYNIDGVGNDGSEWDNFWMGQVRRAATTGHVWVFVEAPAVRPTSLQDEINGLRPYLIGYSPLAVTNWHEKNGELAFAVVRTAEREPRIGTEGMEGNDYGEGFLLLVRAGFAGFGSAFAGGGWWRFDAEGLPVAGMQGTWDLTGGRIPMFPLYYQRVRPTAKRRTMSRPGVTELCNVAVSYMNLGSAADFDAWDAAKSFTWLKGADAEAHNLAATKMREGSQIIPLKPTITPDGVVIPEPVDSGAGAVASGVFAARLEAKRAEAKELAAREVTTSPDASGAAREAAHTEVKSPRLALVASELEAAQRTAISFLEMRNGGTPTGNVTWTRDFPLVDPRAEIEAFFRLQKSSGISSPTLTIKAMMQAAQTLNLATDDEELAVIREEFERSAQQAAERSAQQEDLLAQFGA